MEMLRVGVVGSHELTATQRDDARVRVNSVVLAYRESHGRDGFVVVTGGAEGVDTLAKEASWTFLHRAPELYLPKCRRWEPDGFKARNIIVATVSDVLYCIRSRDSKTYGSGWTADYFDDIKAPREAVRWLV